MASSGFRVAARLAGNTPVRYPTPAENRVMKSKKVKGNENSATD